jgi:AcrR family transcriptional regulator
MKDLLLTNWSVKRYSKFIMARPREFDIDTVLNQCMKVFWVQGYKATSMEDLMKATKLNKQSFYCAFGDKQALFLKALALYRTQSFASIKSILNETDSALEGLQKLFHYLAMPCENDVPGCFMVNTSLEFGTDDPEVHAELQSMFAGFEKFVEQAICRGQQQGQITSCFDSRIMSKNLINTLGGLSILEKRGESLESIQAIMEMTLVSLKT